MFRAHILLTTGLLVLLFCVCGRPVQAQCDTVKTVECAQVAAQGVLDAGCRYTTVVPVLVDCINNNTNSCNEDIKEQWATYINTINESLVNQICSSVCKDATQAKASLQVCEELYGGIAVLTAEILRDGTAPTSPQCAIALKRVRDCILNTTTDCTSLYTPAVEILNSHRDAFSQCQISIPELPTDGANSTVGPGTGAEGASSDSSTQLILYTMLGLSSFVILVAGIIILIIWMLGQRNANFTKGEEHSKLRQYTNNNFSDDRDSVSGRSLRGDYYTRDRSPRRQYDNDSQRDMGPYRPSSVRWWTRPGFGAYGNEVRIPRPF